jgi:GT2 family glycosyltransferase
LNEAEFIEQAVEALRRQTRPLDGILIVDNASTDSTLDRHFPEQVTVIRNPVDIGTSGSVRIGFSHALENGFDWTWVLDADSVPEPDALERLLVFWEHLPPAQQERVCFLNSWPLTETGEVKQQPLRFARSGLEFRTLASSGESTECDCTLWSGSLYRMAAVARIGLPTADYVMDVAEVEYGYRARELGFTSYIVHGSVIHHDVGRISGAEPRVYRLGPINLTFFETSPARTYYSVRNMYYFWVYQYKPRRPFLATRWVAWRFATVTLNFVLGPRNYRGQISACVRGLRDGVMGNMAARY